MRLLSVHADTVEFETISCGSPAVVVFVTVEASDETALGRIIHSAREWIEATVSRLHPETVLFYPTRHLSDEPGGESFVSEILDSFVDALDGQTVPDQPPPDNRLAARRVPGGVPFELSIKAHPHARQSRRITADTLDSRGHRALETDRELRVCLPDGTSQSLQQIADRSATEDRFDAPLDSVISSLASGDRLGLLSPASRDWQMALARHGLLVENERSAGGTVLTPRGLFLRDAIREFLADQLCESGTRQIEITSRPRPVGSNSSRESPGSGSDRQKTAPLTGTVPETVRSILESLTDTGAATPIRLADVETHPARWTLTETATRARELFLEEGVHTAAIIETLGITSVGLLRVSREFYSTHADWIQTVGTRLGPVLVGIEHGKAQSRRPQLSFVGEFDGQFVETGAVWIEDSWHPEKTQSLVCCRPAERIEQAVSQVTTSASQREPAVFPVWLAPTQIRLLPIDPAEHLAYCQSVVSTLADAGLRVDIDSTDSPVSERLQRARDDLIPYVGTVGSTQQANRTLTVTARHSREELELNPTETARRITRRLPEDLPRKRQYSGSDVGTQL